MWNERNCLSENKLQLWLGCEKFFQHSAQMLIMCWMNSDFSHHVWSNNKTCFIVLSLGRKAMMETVVLSILATMASGHTHCPSTERSFVACTLLREPIHSMFLSLGEPAQLWFLYRSCWRERPDGPAQKSVLTKTRQTTDPSELLLHHTSVLNFNSITLSHGVQLPYLWLFQNTD